MFLPIYTEENPIVCDTTAIRDALLLQDAYRVEGLSVRVGSQVWFLGSDCTTWVLTYREVSSNASGLVSATTVVSVSSATAPTAGQVLTATSGTAADWETVLGDGISKPHLSPTGGSTSDLALTTDAATAFPSIILSGLTALRNYNAVLGVEVLQTVDSNTLKQAAIDLKASIAITTDASAVATCTISPTPSPDVNLVPTSLAGATAGLVAVAGGVQVTATRKSGKPSHARYSYIINKFENVGAALALPNTIPGLVSWLRDDALVTAPGGVLSAWGDSSPLGTGGVTATGAEQPTYTSGAGVLCGEGSVRSALNFATSIFASLSAAEVFIVARVDNDPASIGLTAGFWDMGTAGFGSVVPWTDGTVYDAFGSTVRHIAGTSGGVMSSQFLYNVISTATEWTNILNGVQLFTTGTNTVAFPSVPRLASSLGNINYLVGVIFEFGLYNRKLTPTERATATAWFGRER